MAIAPVEVPVAILTPKLDEALRFIAAPVMVIPAVPVKSPSAVIAPMPVMAPVALMSQSVVFKTKAPVLIAVKLLTLRVATSQATVAARSRVAMPVAVRVVSVAAIVKELLSESRVRFAPVLASEMVEPPIRMYAPVLSPTVSPGLPESLTTRSLNLASPMADTK